MSSTITGYYNKSIGLGNPYSYNSPLTITSTGTINAPDGSGVYATAAGVKLLNYGTILGTGQGVTFENGGLVTNFYGGYIYGVGAGLRSEFGHTSTFYNAGNIKGHEDGVSLIFGGLLTNASTGTITGRYETGVYAGAGFGTVFNQGLITGPDASGVLLVGATGYLNNQSGGSIDAEADGVIIRASEDAPAGGFGTVINSGDIYSTQGAGIQFVTDGGFVDNEKTGIVNGAYGIFTDYYTTILNDGSIGGTKIGIDATVNFFGKGGATIINNGTITDGATGGVLLHNGYLSNSNTGTITGTSFGIYLEAAGSIVNQGSVGASAGAGITLTNTGSLINGGSVTGYSYGAELLNGGFISNAAGGYITGFSDGVYTTGATAGTLINTGSIYGIKTGFYGTGFVTNNSGGEISGNIYAVDLSEPGSVTNAGSLFGGHAGVYSGGELTVTNSGSITAGSGAFDNGLKSTGVHLSQGLVVNTISGAETGFIYGHGAGVYIENEGGTVYNTGTIGGATLHGLRGIGVDLYKGGTFTNGGTVFGSLAVAFGKHAAAASELIVLQGALFEGGVTASAAQDNGIELTAGAWQLDMGSSFSGFSTISFDHGAQWTLGGGTDQLAGGETITSFATGDTLDLEGFAATSESYAGGVLTLTNIYGATQSILFAGFPAPLTSADFNLAITGADTDITLCFYPGTRIATPDGSTAVEDLRTGDMVTTTNGTKPIRWIGQSHIATCFADRHRTLPIRIRQNALGAGLPARDLLLSPDHAIFMDNILVHAAALVDGINVTREYAVPEQFIYYHIELDSHELLLAEGLPAESFVNNADRMHFHNWDARQTPTTQIHEMPYPRAKSWRQLPSWLRQRLAKIRAA